VVRKEEGPYVVEVSRHEKCYGSLPLEVRLIHKLLPLFYW